MVSDWLLVPFGTKVISSVSSLRLFYRIRRVNLRLHRLGLGKRIVLSRNIRHRQIMRTTLRQLLTDPKDCRKFLHHTVPSAKAEMTFPRADRDLLMFLASSSTAPSAPVLLTWHRYAHRWEELVHNAQCQGKVCLLSRRFYRYCGADMYRWVYR